MTTENRFLLSVIPAKAAGIQHLIDAENYFPLNNLEDKATESARKTSQDPLS